MRWVYYVPHAWGEEERTVWEDVWLMPESYLQLPPEERTSVWLTVDGYQAEDEELAPDLIEEKTWFDEGEFEIFEKQGYIIREEEGDMIVKDRDFSMDELLEWIKIFLLETTWVKEKYGEFDAVELVEGTFEDFSGTNDDADAISSAKEAYDEFMKDPEAGLANCKSWDELIEEWKADMTPEELKKWEDAEREAKEKPISHSGGPPKTLK